MQIVCYVFHIHVHVNVRQCIPVHVGSHQVYMNVQNCRNGNHQLSFNYFLKNLLLYDLLLLLLYITIIYILLLFIHIINYTILYILLYYPIIFQNSTLSDGCGSDHNAVQYACISILHRNIRCVIQNLHEILRYQ